jgi:ATP-dependent RNA helicase DDX56/DBP9
VEEAQLPGAAQLAQYHIRCDEEDKFVLIYALFKLRLIKGKTIVFVANTDRCYRLVILLNVLIS